MLIISLSISDEVVLVNEMHRRRFLSKTQGSLDWFIDGSSKIRYGMAGKTKLRRR